jgi:hypothetical protein
MFLLFEKGLAVLTAGPMGDRGDTHADGVT